MKKIILLTLIINYVGLCANATNQFTTVKDLNLVASFVAPLDANISPSITFANLVAGDSVSVTENIAISSDADRTISCSLSSSNAITTASDGSSLITLYAGGDTTSSDVIEITANLIDENVCDQLNLSLSATQTSLATADTDYMGDVQINFVYDTADLIVQTSSIYIDAQNTT